MLLIAGYMCFHESSKIVKQDCVRFVHLCLPVIHMSLVQHTMAITDDRIQNLLPAKHLSLEQL